MSIRWGDGASRPRLVSSLHITPDEMMARSVDSRHRPGCSSRARQDGLGEGVAHDGDGVHVVAVDGVEQLDGVEAAVR